MPLIHVRALPGRAAFTAPRGGQRIPDDKFITVPLTAWIRGLIERHGDIEFRQPDPSRPVASIASNTPAKPAVVAPVTPHVNVAPAPTHLPEIEPTADPVPEPKPRRKSHRRQRAGSET